MHCITAVSPQPCYVILLCLPTVITLNLDFGTSSIEMNIHYLQILAKGLGAVSPYYNAFFGGISPLLAIPLNEPQVYQLPKRFSVRKLAGSFLTESSYKTSHQGSTALWLSGLFRWFTCLELDS